METIYNTLYIFMTLIKGHGCGIDYQKFACLHDKVSTTNLIILKHSSFIALVMVNAWWDFRDVMLETVFLANLLYQILDVFFQGQTLMWPYIRNVSSDWCET